MGTFFQDVRFGWRRLKASPGFTAVAVLSLALGIGANTAIFTLVNTVLLRPLPVAEPERLASVYPVARDEEVGAFSYPDYRDFRDRNEVFTGLFVHRFAPMSLSREGQSERVWGYLVSGNYFDVLGVSAARGRTFLPEEDVAPLRHPVVVVSHASWQTRFGGDPNLIGKTVQLNGHPFSVVGVAPEGFQGSETAYTPELWAPMMMQPVIEPGFDWLEKRDNHNLFATGRLKPGVTYEQAVASLNILARQLGEEYPDTNEGMTMTLTPPGLIHPILRGPVIGFTGALMGVVALVLLIACTNLANLLLARAADRRKEIAIRLALGASRLRLVRQLLTESVLLALMGGAAGWLLALWVVDVVTAFKPPVNFPLTIDLQIDWRVFAFSLVASVLTGIVFGIVPALQTTNPELVPALKDGAAQGGARRTRLRSALVVAQVALSLVLLVAAGLVVRTLQHVQTMSPGFDPEGALTMSVDVGLQGYDEARGRQFYRQLLERLRALPGVESATAADFLPLSLNYNAMPVFIEGQPAERGANVPTAMNSSVATDYLKTMGIPLVRGRDFGERDREDAPRVVVVNEAFARRYFPGADPVAEAIGHRVSSDAEGPWYEIVGVAGDGKYFGISEAPRPFIYLSLGQRYSSNASLVVRTKGDPRAMIAAVRGEVRGLDESLPVFDVKTMTEHLGISLFPARVAGALLGAFGLLALTLAAVGIYGVMSYSVAQRTHEIGVRVALGARPRDVLGLIVRQGMTLAVVGIVLGLLAAFAAVRALGNLLYGVGATDPLTFAGVTLILASVALAACLIPARRATKVDPMVALRYE
ncbi:MAG TPA: ABC transporter permease [Pyrinomonadaceae bacterium]